MAAMTARQQRWSLENPQPKQTSYGRCGRSRTRKKGKRPRAEHWTNGNDRTVSLPDQQALVRPKKKTTPYRRWYEQCRWKSGAEGAASQVPWFSGSLAFHRVKGLVKLERIWRATNAFWAPPKKSAPKPPLAMKPRREWHIHSQRSARNAENVCTHDMRMRHVARPTIRTRTKNQSPAAATTWDALACTGTVRRRPRTEQNGTTINSITSDQ